MRSSLFIVMCALPCLVVASGPQDKPLFHPDAEHVWNKAHQFLYRQDPKKGIDDQERLEPVDGGWTESRFLDKGASPKEAIELLDALLAGRAERRVNNPRKRAVFQHDLWDVFTRTTGPAPGVVRALPEGRLVNTQRFVDDGDTSLPRKRQRRELQRRLVQAMRMAALTQEEIKALPDNLADAVKSGRFPRAFDPKLPDRPFLPSDLLAPNGSWVVVTNPAESSDQGTMGAPMHTATFKGRSVFTVLIRLPGGRQKTAAFVKELLEGKLPPLPAGSQTALLRRMILIDDQGRLTPTSLTESLQLRAYQGEEDIGTPFAFKLSRAGLFAGKAEGLQPLNLKDHNCGSCHGRTDGDGVRSIASLYAGERQRQGLAASDLKTQERSTMAWTQKTFSWGLLQGLWESKASR